MIKNTKKENKKYERRRYYNTKVGKSCKTIKENQYFINIFKKNICSMQMYIRIRENDRDIGNVLQHINKKQTLFKMIKNIDVMLNKEKEMVLG